MQETANAGNLRDTDLIPGSGGSPGRGYGNALQYSCQKIPWTEAPGRPQAIGRTELDMMEVI